MYDFIIRTRTRVDAGELEKKLHESPENSISFYIMDWRDEYYNSSPEAEKIMYMYLAICDSSNPGRGIRVYGYDDRINVEFKFQSSRDEIPVLQAVVGALLELTGEEKIKHYPANGSEIITFREFKNFYNYEWYDKQFKATNESAMVFFASMCNKPDSEYYMFTADGLKKGSKIH